MSLNASPVDALAWFEKIKDYFKDFRPEAKSMTINFARKTSDVGLAIKIDEGFRKNHNKIKIPAYKRFSIVQMQDASFTQIKSLWKQVDGEWILDAKDLPPSDGYFIKLEGSIDEKSLNELVHIKPSVNRDSNDEIDRYWLDASLKSPRTLEKIWTELQIDELSVGVKVDVNKLFGLKVPQEIKDKSDAIQKYLYAGKQGDRNLLFRSMQNYKRQEKKTSFHPNDFLRIIQNLTAREILIDYLSVEKNYSIGDIDHPTKYKGIVPQDVKVQAMTTLTLQEPQSIGYLTLQRKRYLRKIEEEFDKALKK